MLGAVALLAGEPRVLGPLWAERWGGHGLAAQTTERADGSLADWTATPESAVDLFLRSVRSIRWSAAAQFIAPATLDRFRATVTMIADADTTGGLRGFLTGTDSVGLSRLDAATVFDRSIGAVIDDMPGLMHAIFDRDDEVLGHVPELADRAHVVYRTTARISGAVSEVKVMQLERGPGGWRVLWSDELEVLDAALRGIARGRAARRDDVAVTLRQPQRHVQVIGRPDVAQRVEAEAPQRQLDEAIAPLRPPDRAEVDGVHVAALLLEVQRRLVG